MAWNEPDPNKPEPKKNPWERRQDRAPRNAEEWLRHWQQRLSGMFGGGGSGGADRSGINWTLIIGLALAVWSFTGVYVVGAAERGVVLRFGKFVRTAQPGPHIHWPWPIESRFIVDVARNESIEDKTRMLTSDENLVDITIAVQYLRAKPIDFLFQVRDPEQTLRDVSESAIREIVGQSKLDAVLGAGRQEITERTKTVIQRTLNNYKTGIDILTVNLTAVNVPEQVAPSQRDAIKAREDRDRYTQEAQAYANDIVPKARGQASRQLQEAQAYHSQVTLAAEGEASRFSQVLEAYQRSPKVTRERLYIETMENVLGKSRKVLLDTKPGSSNVIYLPLDKLMERQGSAPPLAPAAQPAQQEPDGITVDGRGRGDR